MRDAIEQSDYWMANARLLVARSRERISLTRLLKRQSDELVQRAGRILGRRVRAAARDSS